MFKTKVISIIVMAACLLMAIQGCGRNDPSPGPNEVWIIGWTYEPNALTVPVGTTVTWNNTTLEYHTVTSDDGTFNFLMDAGSSFNFTFTKPGTYVYHDVSTDPQTEGVIIVK